MSIYSLCICICNRMYLHVVHGVHVVQGVHVVLVVHGGARIVLVYFPREVFCYTKG